VGKKTSNPPESDVRREGWGLRKILFGLSGNDNENKGDDNTDKKKQLKKRKNRLGTTIPQGGKSSAPTS